jgi:hypothetical protein
MVELQGQEVAQGLYVGHNVYVIMGSGCWVRIVQSNGNFVSNQRQHRVGRSPVARS